MKIVIRDHPKLYKETELSSFLGISPRDPNGWEKVKSQLVGRHYRRGELSDLLCTYNRAIGNDVVALQQIEKLKDASTYCVMTGQQLGFMGGPSYTILKAVSCLLLARNLNAIPIFWAATEDHDVDEIDHTYLLDTFGNINKFHLSLPKDGRFVEELQVTSKHVEVIQRFLDAVDLQEFFYETSYTKMMIRFLVRLFAGTGLIFVEPYLLRPFAKDFFRREMIESDQIAQTLRDTTQKYEAAGGTPQMDISEGTNLFLKMEGKYRCKIIKKEKTFFVGRKEIFEKTLLELIDCESERFSTNVVARTVLQSGLFPTIAYVAGPGELAYYHQLLDYHRYHDVPMPWIVPRMSATFISPVAQDMMDKCHLKPWQEIPHHWTQLMPDIEEGIHGLTDDWLQSGLKYFAEDLSPEALSSFIRHNMHKLQRKICMRKLHRQGIPSYSLHYLRNLFHPHEKLQERILNWMEFQSQSKENLIDELLRQVDWRTEGHHYCMVLQ